MKGVAWKIERYKNGKAKAENYHDNRTKIGLHTDDQATFSSIQFIQDSPAKDKNQQCKKSTHWSEHTLNSHWGLFNQIESHD